MSSPFSPIYKIYYLPKICRQQSQTVHKTQTSSLRQTEWTSCYWTRSFDLGYSNFSLSRKNKVEKSTSNALKWPANILAQQRQLYVFLTCWVKSLRIFISCLRSILENSLSLSVWSWVIKKIIIHCFSIVGNFLVQLVGMPSFFLPVCGKLANIRPLWSQSFSCKQLEETSWHQHC